MVIVINITMFTEYSYKTLKYYGLSDIFTTGVKLSLREREFLKQNMLSHAIIQTPVSALKIYDNLLYSSVVKNPKKDWESRVIAWYDDMEYGSFRYIDDIILEYVGETTLEKNVSFTIDELKILVKKNYGIVKGNANLRQSWVYAYIDTVLLGFNTFALRSQLNDDLLREIRKFL